MLVLLLLFICRFSSFTFSFRHHPHSSMDYRQVFRPILYFSPAHCRVIHNTFLFNHSVILLPRALRFWVCTSVFYLTLLTEILAQPAFIKVSLGAGTYFLESCRASYWSSKHRSGSSVCLIHSNPQSSIHLNFVFMHVNIAKVLLMVKTLIKSAATLFSSDENIKQQPN